MKLYFENAVTTVTTLMILALLGYISWSAAHRAAIQHWGCRSLFLLAFGLAVCCCAAARDGLDKTIQQAIDGSCAPGLFQLVSVPTIVGCIGALVIVIAAIATPIMLVLMYISTSHQLNPLLALVLSREQIPILYVSASRLPEKACG